MKKLLVNAPSGKQELIEVGDGGGYFDSSRVLWDERIDGPVPSVTIGGMVRAGDSLVFNQSRMDETTTASAPDAAKQLAENIEQLWQAANAYTESFISGVAIGLLTIGVIQGKPKALAVTGWSSQVWDAYYTRKALITATHQESLDFSSFGPMPHSVPELRAELGM